MSEVGNIQRWRVGHFAPISCLGPRWDADLRIEFPVVKGWLVLQEPIDGFRDQHDYDRFSAFCGSHRSRQAVAAPIYRHILAPLEAALKGPARDTPDSYTAFYATVQHVFLDIGGDALDPTTVQLTFVGPASLPAPLVEQLDQWREETFWGRRPGLRRPPERLPILRPGPLR